MEFCLLSFKAFSTKPFLFLPKFQN